MKGPYFRYADALEARYGGKTQKLTLAGGKTCPTRDGTYGPKMGWGGCSFCDAYGSASFFSHQRRALSVTEQLQASAPAVRERSKAEHFVAYFQSYTTTHQELAEFKERYDQAVEFPDVVALAVGTRPDCLPDEVIEMLCAYMDRVDIQLELGVQSFSDQILHWFDRGHDVACAREAIERALLRGREAELRYGKPGAFHLCVHLILGAPGESEADVVRAAEECNRLGVHGVKLHNLHVLQKTKLARLYSKENFHLLSMEEYAERTALFLRHLNPGIVIHRTHGVAPNPEELIAPAWSSMKVRPAQYIRDMMLERGWQQGDLLGRAEI